MGIEDPDGFPKLIEKPFRITIAKVKEFTMQEADAMDEICEAWEGGRPEIALEKFEELRVHMDSFITNCLNDLGFLMYFDRHEFFVKYREENMKMEKSDQVGDNVKNR